MDKKSAVVVLSVLLTVAWILLHNSTGPRGTWTKGEMRGNVHLLLVQEDKEDKGGTDPHFLLILKKLQEQLNEWLKSVNERIESQDITRFEVRFLEILRNVLEWVKEKLDAKIESSEKEKPKTKERGLFRETRQKVSPISGMG